MTKEIQMPLEILIATMNRNSLQFLDTMFQRNDISNYCILIINQTTEAYQIESNSSRIRVINSFENGLSRSRNLAIKNAIGDVCLLADDDVIFEKDFQKEIISSYSELPQADLIAFKTKTLENRPYSNYPNKIVELESFYKKVLSIEITFKRQSITENNLLFDEEFGLGSTFQDGENRLFLKSVLDHKKLKSYFVPKCIVQHDAKSSSDEVSSDRFIFARSALNYKQNGFSAYFYIIKLLLSLLRKGFIKLNQVIPKWKVAIEGIKTYKSQINV